MTRARLEALSDGVIAIVLTIMVLELKLPADGTTAGLIALWPTFVAYALSFLIVAILWVNHHHVLSVVRSVDAPLLWWNNLLLFWISLVPFCTAYLGQHPLQELPVAIYGANLCACSVAFWMLRRSISARDSIASALHRRPLRKNAIAAMLYALSVFLAAWSTAASFCVFLVVPALYFMPQRKLEDVS